MHLFDVAGCVARPQLSFLEELNQVLAIVRVGLPSSCAFDGGRRGAPLALLSHGLMLKSSFAKDR